MKLPFMLLFMFLLRLGISQNSLGLSFELGTTNNEFYVDIFNLKSDSLNKLDRVSGGKINIFYKQRITRHISLSGAISYGYDYVFFNYHPRQIRYTIDKVYRPMLNLDVLISYNISRRRKDLISLGLGPSILFFPFGSGRNYYGTTQDYRIERVNFSSSRPQIGVSSQAHMFILNKRVGRKHRVRLPIGINSSCYFFQNFTPKIALSLSFGAEYVF